MHYFGTGAARNLQSNLSYQMNEKVQFFLQWFT